MKLGKFLKMIDAYTDINTTISIRRDICTTPIVKTRLITAGFEAFPYEKMNVVEFGIHNGEIHIVIK